MYTNEDEGYDYTGTNDGGTTFVHEDGEGAKTSGVRYNRASISEVCILIILTHCFKSYFITNHNLPGKKSWKRCNPNTLPEI